MNLRPYPGYKDSGVEWIGDIPKGWQISRIKNHIKIAKSGDWGSEKQKNKNDMICVRVADFDYDKGIIHNENYTIRNISSDKNDLILNKGDLLLEKSGGGEKQPVGRVVIFNKDFKAVCSNFVTKLEIYDEDNSKYFYYLFKSLYSRKINTKSIKQTTGIQNLDSYSYFMEIIAAPNIEEQNSIVSFLDKKTSKIDKTIEKDTRLIELLQEKRTALINHMVTKGLDPEAIMKDSGIEWIGEIPEGWESRRIRTLSLVRRGASPRPIDDPNYFDVNGEYSWVRISDVTASNKYLNETSEKLSTLGKSLSVTIEPGELFISIAASVGKPIISNIKCCIHDGFIYFQNLGVNEEYLFYIFIGGQAFQGLGKLGTQLNLNTETIAGITIPVPPKDEQRLIASYLDKKTSKIDQTISKIQSNIQLLKEYKKSLIHHVVTGKVDVRDVV